MKRLLGICEGVKSLAGHPKRSWREKRSCVRDLKAQREELHLEKITENAVWALSLRHTNRTLWSFSVFSTPAYSYLAQAVLKPTAVFLSHHFPSESQTCRQLQNIPHTPNPLESYHRLPGLFNHFRCLPAAHWMQVLSFRPTVFISLLFFK